MRSTINLLTQCLLKAPRVVLIALCAVASLPIFSVLIIAASLPRISVEFGIAESRSGLLLAFNLLGLAVGFLAGGPLQARCGAKAALLSGMAALGALAALTSGAHSFQSFVLLRLLQAIAAGVSLCAVGPIIRIVWEGDPIGAARANVAVATSTAFGPILGLPAGSVLELYGDWRLGVLIVAALAAAVVAFAHFSLSAPQKRVVLPTTASAAHPALVRSVAAFGLVGALSLAVVYAFMTVSPMVLLSLCRLPEWQFGALSILPPLGMLFFGTLVRAGLARGSVSISVVGPAAATAQVLAGAGFLAAALIPEPEVWLFVVCSVVCAAANGLLLAYSVTLALQRVPRHQLGSGSALVGFLHMSGAGAGSAVVSLLALESRLALSFVVLAASAANVLLAWRLHIGGLA
jgi:MFS family permease